MDKSCGLPREVFALRNGLPTQVSLYDDLWVFKVFKSDCILSTGTRPEYLPTVPEDSFASNQVVPSGYDNSVSFASSHNTTMGSYRPPDRMRTFQPLPPKRPYNHYKPLETRGSISSDNQSPLPYEKNPVIDTSALNAVILPGALEVHENRVCSKNIPPKPTKRLSPIRSKEQNVPSFSVIKNNGYHGHKRGGLYHGNSDGEISDNESECTDTAIKYSCVDMSTVMSTQLATPKEIDDDGGSTTTSGSYVVDPSELCEQIDDIFFSDMGLWDLYTTTV